MRSGDCPSHSHDYQITGVSMGLHFHVFPENTRPTVPISAKPARPQRFLLHVKQKWTWRNKSKTQSENMMKWKIWNIAWKLRQEQKSSDNWSINKISLIDKNQECEKSGLNTCKIREIEKQSEFFPTSPVPPSKGSTSSLDPALSLPVSSLHRPPDLYG